jgi:hypothetical protein
MGRKNEGGTEKKGATLAAPFFANGRRLTAAF